MQKRQIVSISLFHDMSNKCVDFMCILYIFVEEKKTLKVKVQLSPEFLATEYKNGAQSSPIFGFNNTLTGTSSLYGAQRVFQSMV